MFWVRPPPIILKNRHWCPQVLRQLLSSLPLAARAPLLLFLKFWHFRRCIAAWVAAEDGGDSTCRTALATALAGAAGATTEDVVGAAVPTIRGLTSSPHRLDTGRSLRTQPQRAQVSALKRNMHAEQEKGRLEIIWHYARKIAHYDQITPHYQSLRLLTIRAQILK